MVRKMEKNSIGLFFTWFQYTGFSPVCAGSSKNRTRIVCCCLLLLTICSLFVLLFFAFLSPPFEGIWYALRPYGGCTKKVISCCAPTRIVNTCIHTYFFKQGRDDGTLFSLRKQAKCTYKKTVVRCSTLLASPSSAP